VCIGGSSEIFAFLCRCARLGLIALAYLWRQPQAALYQQMLDTNLDAILIKVAAMGLDPKKHLGKTLSQMQAHLHKIVGLPFSHNTDHRLIPFSPRLERAILRSCMRGGWGI